MFGKQYSQDLLPVEVHTALCSITGFVGKPEGARKKGGHDYFFVNGRYMRHPYFHKAVQSAYDRLVPEGMQVPYFLYFEVEPAEIDVNIHPTKTEIKFQNEQAIWQILLAAVRDALGKFCEVPAIDFDMQGSPDIPVFDPTRQVVPPQPKYNADYNPFKKPSVPEGWTELYEAAIPTVRQTDSTGSLFDGPDESSLDVAPQAPLVEKSPSHYQYKGRYLMTAVKSGLMIIDQYRADVRVRYERYMEQFHQHTASTQRLLFPEAVQFAPSEAVVLEKILPELAGIGFEVSSLGGNSFAVNGMPAGLDGLDPVSLLRQLVTEAASDVQLSDLHARLALGLARSAAIPYGQVLTNDEMESLINDLFSCSNVNYTPDGKAILSILPQTDIEHLLG